MMCAPTPLLVLVLCAGVVWSEAQAPSLLGCTNKEDCLKRLLLAESDLSAMSRLSSANLLPPKEPNRLNSLLELYQRKYLDSKRDVKNFQTQGWK